VTEGGKTQIVIVGGGAAGLELAAKLGARYGRKKHDIILVDRNRTHIWKPLLHGGATSSLDANLDETGYRSHCRRWGYRYFHGSLRSVDPQRRQVILARCSTMTAARSSVAMPSAMTIWSWRPDRHQRFRHAGGGPELPVPRRTPPGRPLPYQAAQPLPARLARDERQPVRRSRVRVAIVGAGATGVELSPNCSTPPRR
jgi:NADH dehydrogenase